MLSIKFILISLLMTLLASGGEAAVLQQANECKNCNLIVISLTSLRKKNMSIYGYQRKTTPSIDKFFEHSYQFSNAFAPASLTFTDAISLFFSLSPNIHKAFIRKQKHRIGGFLKKHTSMTEVLSSAGYNTAAFVSDEDYDYQWGIGRTFQYYFDRTYYAENSILFHPFTYTVGTKQLVPIANRWLDSNYKKKFFLFLQGYDMHCPYSPGDPFASLYQSPHASSIPFTTECFMTRNGPEFVKQNGKTKQVLKSFFAFLKQKEIPYYFDKADIEYLISRYDAELTQADYNLAALFEKIKSLNLDKNTVIVFLSEHGDYLGENGYFMKPSPGALGNLHNANLNFPLLIKLPNQSKKVAQNQLFQTIDIAPTLLDILGLRSSEKMQGKSFKSVLNTNSSINEYAYGFSQRHEVDEKTNTVFSVHQLETIQNTEWKLNSAFEFKEPLVKVDKPEFYLYNLKKDPSEKNNIIKSEPAIFERLKQAMVQKKIHYSLRKVTGTKSKNEK